MYASREDEDYVPREAKEFYKIYVKAGALSPEIVKNREIQEEDSESPIFTERTSKHVVVNDVYVAVGKDDTDVLKWTLENAASSGSTRVFLVHVFPPVTHVPTPVGRLARSQLNEDQVRLYVKEESNKRSNLLQKYVNLCNDARVTAETILHESNCTEESILNLIPALSITHLVIGTKRHSRRAGKQLSLGEFVKNNAPDFCEVSIIHKGNEVEVNQQVDGPTTAEKTRHFEKTLLFSCFPVRGKAKIS
ncbi:U-box domain-containing protein 52-like [Pyrus x bretschneideri]|uniref:U-box domain-containing protein 52-like n=1 Tax=Pyrus x bretschneideri TaxID=225117 RepID=UPI00202E7A38|nr:U-box domain-containing protein 52-like [Pyrus x bretschneideri]